jgi:hypothetical protein
MNDPFSEISHSWKRLADQLGGMYSDDPPELPDGLKAAFWRPPALTFKHRHWKIKLSSNPLMPRLACMPPLYVVFVQADFKATRTFDIALKSTETVDYRIGVMLSPLDFLYEYSKKHVELEKQLFPVELKTARTNVIDIDLHYVVKSYNPDDPQIIFSEPTVREALLATPKVGVRIHAFTDKKLDMPIGTGSENILSMELFHPDEKERIIVLVRLYKAILDRLASIEFILPEVIG